MTSRLDRLFVLLDTGSSPLTRKAAALQLGEVQKLHPHELDNLLDKLLVYLRSSSWDTRIAAGQAVEAVVKNVPKWNPAGTIVKSEGGNDDISRAGQMKLDEFDIGKVLENGACLLGSEGKEYELGEDLSGMDSKERLARQRQVLNRRLGLEAASKIGFDTSEIFSNEDLMAGSASPGGPNGRTARLEVDNRRAVAEIVRDQMSKLEPNLSSREKNRAKRKAKLVAKQKSREVQDAINNASNGAEAEEPEMKKRRNVGFTPMTIDHRALEDNASMDSVSDAGSSLTPDESGEWPLESMCDQLCQDLFSPLWETRHGAATALREIVRIHGSGAGKTLDTAANQLENANQSWLEDLALRFLCVLALDRFGDFVSDQVVAPVRETCAQGLGVVLDLLVFPKSVFGVMRVLLQMLEQKEWEARHGGLLGLKYLLAVRKDMTKDLLPLIFPPVFLGLRDPVDDVSAAAASALVPISESLVANLPDEIPNLIATLWDSLLELDDLTASTDCIMTLLASILSNPAIAVQKSNAQPMDELVPRLWPFLNHASSAVRKATLQTFISLLMSPSCTTLEGAIWLAPILQDALRHMYQRCLFEHVPSILELCYKVWKRLLEVATLEAILNAACPCLSSWLCLMMQPAQLPFEHSAILEAKHRTNEKNSKQRTRNPSNSEYVAKALVAEKFYIGGCETLNGTILERDNAVYRARCLAARFLGLLSGYVTLPMPSVVYSEGVESPVNCYARLLLFHLNSASALQKLAIALITEEWTKFDNKCEHPEAVKNRILECLTENVYYDEIAISFTRMQQDCKDFISSLQHHKLNVDSVFNPGSVLTFDQATALTTTVFQTLVSGTKLKPKVLETLEERRKSVVQVITQTNQDQLILTMVVQASLAGAVVALRCLPEKLNPVIKPLMESIKKEEVEMLQERSAKNLVYLMDQCLERVNPPNPKIIKNICSLLCSNIKINGETVAGSTDTYNGIQTLVNLQKHAERITLRRSTSTLGKSRTVLGGVEVNSDENPMQDDEWLRQNEIQHRGAKIVLNESARYFGVDLPGKLPSLWETMLGPLMKYVQPECFDADAMKANDPAAIELAHCLHILEVVCPALHPNLHSQLADQLGRIRCCLEHPYTIVRHVAARCFGALSQVITAETMTVVLDRVLPLLGAMDCDTKRIGAIEALANIIDQLGFGLVPYIVLLVVPVMGCMSDPNVPLRLMATHCFATMIRLVPLEGGIPDPPTLKPEMVDRKNQERKFLEQLFDAKRLENYTVPVQINAELRSYQQDGVNWLAFLNRYKLHGILCDDMGLGKTLQSICILAGDHFYREQEYKKSKSVDCSPSPSLVICPPTLTGHWVYEVEKFVGKKLLTPLHYTGPPMERLKLRSKAKKSNLIIASYDIVRNDIEFFSTIRWNYCILDEGHIIKNGKTKLSRAIKQLVANHRVILSGTPIQNNVIELWSLFDFLMPGFLGTEKQFTARYSKPILLSRDAKSSSKEQEAGALAMESLHRQVLPFLLRRMKEDVLKDLPPKIMQDYYCDLSPLQERLYEDFAKSKAKRCLEDSLVHEEASPMHGTAHIFQALQYLRKVCNHPKLVLTPQHPQYEQIVRDFKTQDMPLSEISHAAKLPALRQLLLDCGIGAEVSAGGAPEIVVNQHRALIFCQLKAMLDILEKDLFLTHMPNVTYLRLDGSIPPGQRHAVVHRFNNDPSIDVLLLTTQVGGLGINLTGADTVIFVEHDWNPMKDLQAMDRAHRIGQKKVVNVYRLITKGTLEEKIMGLQKFKITVANTVISHENSSLQSMGTDQLLELFAVDANTKGQAVTPPTGPSGSSAGAGQGTPKAKDGSTAKGIRAVLENLSELWDERQYESEYNLAAFMQTLKHR